MEELNEKQIEKLQKLAEFAGRSDISETLPIYEKLEEIAESLQKIADKEMPETPKIEMPEVHKIEIEGAEVITIKGDKGDKPVAGVDYPIPENGNDYVLTEADKREIASKIKIPIVEKVIEKTEVIKEQPIVTNEIKEVAIKDTPEQIKEKLLEVGIAIDDIEDLRKELDDLKKKWTSRPMFGGGGFNYSAMNLHIVDEETPTGDVNGVNTEFTLANTPSPVTSLKVYKDGQRQKLTTDYTYSGGTITFVSAPLIDSIITCEYRT
jgi:hypothetical protein